MIDKTVICALATPSINSAISIIRISGNNCFKIVKNIIRFNNNKNINNLKGYTIHKAEVIENDKIIDEVIVSIFKSPLSYTGENMIEISCHGSTYIQQKILNLIIKNGARLANRGEFTLRAFINGKIDLSQAEAIADLISSKNAASHKIAINNVRGGFKNELAVLREKLLNLASLLELELDFSEEDVEFANRTELFKTVNELNNKFNKLKESFELGNVIKNGILITIAGKTNVGKSTLLNTILNDEKAIVSDVHGTTRDVIEDEINYKNITLRFADTAGLRNSNDKIENLGISRSLSQIKKAKVILLVFDNLSQIENIKLLYKKVCKSVNNNQFIIVVINKSDLIKKSDINKNNLLNILRDNDSLIKISAKKKKNINELLDLIYSKVITNEKIFDDIIISNTRHYEALCKASVALKNVIIGMKKNINTDLLIIDIKEVLNQIGSITGQISTNEILNNIFKNFCIGK